MKRHLEGRSIVVTGAAAGLGRAYAVACARAGADLVVNDVDGEGLADLVDRVQALGARAVGVSGSVASWDVAGELVAAAESTYGRLDGLVANAGIKHEALPWEERPEQLRAVVEVNVLGVAYCSVRAIAAMAHSGQGGSVVTVVSGARFGIPHQSAYGGTKGAVAGLTAGWARDAEAIGVRVNAISPLAETPMASQDLRADRPFLAAPDDVAPLVVALLSDAASGVTGRVFRFDGVRLSEYVDPPLRVLADAAAPGELGDVDRLIASLA